MFTRPIYFSSFSFSFHHLLTSMKNLRYLAHEMAELWQFVRKRTLIGRQVLLCVLSIYIVMSLIDFTVQIFFDKLSWPM